MAGVKTSISWQAPEYTEHPHSFGWYSLLGLATAALVAVVYLVTKDIFAVVIIALLGTITGISASRKPRVVTYKLLPGSLSIEDKSYILAQYKSFSLANEDKLIAATLSPLKRFALPVSIYILPEDADKVLDALSAQMAHDDRAPDLVDQLAHRLRF